MNHRKIGILNLTWNFNNGANLLPYAIQKILAKRGYESESVNYFPAQPDENGEVVSIFEAENRTPKEKIESCNSFKKRFIRFSDEKYIGTDVRNVDKYDMILLGSDILWTPISLLHPETPRLYAEYYYHFLKFVDENTRKIAWSSSIGTEDEQVLNAMKPIFRKELKEFDHISIREKSSAEYIQTLTEKPVYNLCDPVLNLGIEDFDEMMSQEAKGPDYIYCFLFEDYEGVYEAINRLSAEFGLPVIAAVKCPEKINNLLENCSFDGPDRFVERIRNASLVISDAYHAVIFSLLAKKNFVCYPRPDTNIRMKNLLDMLELPHKMVSDSTGPIEALNLPIDWESVYERLGKERAKTSAFLDQFLPQR